MNRKTIFYFTSSYPTHEQLLKFISSVDGEVVKYVELGLPSMNPLYDGPSIRKTHSDALRNFHFSHLAEYGSILTRKGVRPYLLAYYNDFAQRGERMLDDLADAGFAGLLIPDLLIDHADVAQSTIASVQKKLEFIPFFNPATPDAIVSRISGMTRSWVYYGLQPSTGIEIPYDLAEVSSRIRELLPSREVNFGFGIRNLDQVREIMSLGSDGVAIGTMIIPMLTGHDLEAFLKFQHELGEVAVA